MKKVFILLVSMFFIFLSNVSYSVPLGPPRWAPYLEKSAANGNVIDQVTLGYIYETGSGIKQDYKKAAYWYQKASNAEVSSKNDEASKWFLRAAQQGHAKSAEELGLLYTFGIGVKRDVENGLFWGLISKKTASKLEQDTNYDIVAGGWSLNASQHKALQERVLNWKAAVEVQKNVSKNAPLIDKANAGDAESQYQLGKSYENADLGNIASAISDAQIRLGNLYVAGKGVPKSYSKAAELFSRAIKQNDRYTNDAEVPLGNLYAAGNGVKQDAEKAKELYMIAIQSCGYINPVLGEVALGQLYLKGAPGFEKNYSEAYYLLSLAVKRQSGAQKIEALDLKQQAAVYLTADKIAELDKRPDVKPNKLCVTSIP